MVYIQGENKPAGPSADRLPVLHRPEPEDRERLIVHRGESAYAVLNLYPYSPGHVLVCPYRHVADYTDLTPERGRRGG